MVEKLTRQGAAYKDIAYLCFRLPSSWLINIMDTLKPVSKASANSFNIYWL
ncbi:hypothetical protein ALQ72_03326 [Pseudomonas syringae pv. maculicola]|nr:hypothetical protein ALQ72_03326 [Pseudomonas syringae pv. maculicola]RMO77494.1 hypothetical protein ALQ34_103877 [Pseudomonas syringae pv. maculicola]